MSFSYEIIVVDNASSDGSIQAIQELQKHNKDIILIENKTNLGFAKANNEGVKHAKGNTFLFLNSDIIVLDDAIEKLYAFYQTNEKKYQFAGGKLLNKNHTPQPSCGPFYSLPVIFGALFLRGDYWGLTRLSPEKTIQTDWVSGACIMTKRKYFDVIGGFDENIFMYMDEIDLLYRARKKGFFTAFYPLSVFIHLGSSSSGKRTYPILQVYKGFLYFYKKHHAGLSLLLLTIMLQLKAYVALFIGKITRNTYLIHTYEQALKLTQMD